MASCRYIRLFQGTHEDWLRETPPSSTDLCATAFDVSRRAAEDENHDEVSVFEVTDEELEVRVFAAHNQTQDRGNARTGNVLRVTDGDLSAVGIEVE